VVGGGVAAADVVQQLPRQRAQVVFVDRGLALPRRRAAGRAPDAAQDVQAAAEVEGARDAFPQP
jgi:hypothetical protein